MRYFEREDERLRRCVEGRSDDEATDDEYNVCSEESNRIAPGYGRECAHCGEHYFGYAEKPSAAFPTFHNNGHWVYIIDLDNDSR